MGGAYVPPFRGNICINTEANITMLEAANSVEGLMILSSLPRPSVPVGNKRNQKKSYALHFEALCSCPTFAGAMGPPPAHAPALSRHFADARCTMRAPALDASVLEEFAAWMTTRQRLTS
eukprot:84802-Pelagomonas_calceolata.AAC.5